MRLSRFIAPRLLLCIVAMLSLCGVMLAAPAVDAASHGPSTTFAVSGSTQIPGQTLAPGTYTIRVVDRLSDRMILEVTRSGGKRSTFLALPRTNLSIPAGSGPVVLRNGTGTTAIRAFKFSDGTFAEFVYPKAEAVTIAKANSTTIPAVDPASEGRSPLPDLSKDDLQEVTLWMLTPTPVGPDASGPGVSAKRYQAPPTSEVASAQVPVKPRFHPKPVVAVLPHTASEMPLLALLTLLSMAGAGMMLRRRLAQVA